MPLKVAAYLKGVGITKVTLDDKNNLIFTMSNGKEENVGALNVDDALSDESRNPVQNMILTQIINAIRSELTRIDTESKGRDDIGKQYTDSAVGAVIRQLNEHIATFQGFLDYANPQLARVESGSVVTDNTSQRVIRGSNKPVSGDAVYQSLASKVDKVDGKGLSTNDYTTEEKAKVAKIEGKQDALTLTVKDNGNIVLGNIAGQTKEFMPATPSGDPMHYAYIDAGATWSSSTGYWSLNGLTDITNDEMRKIHNFGFINDLSLSVFMGKMAKIRTNYLRVGNTNYNGTQYPIESLAYGNTTIEVITLKDSTGVYESVISAQNFNNAFYGCTKLREIHGRLQTSAIITNTFSGCESLQRVRIHKLVANVSFKDCPNIDKDSILYNINNSAATSAITIRLHPTAYAKYSADSDIQAALAAKPLVTLISA